MDPTEERSGINLYSYVGNDPTTEIDKLGLSGSDPNGNNWQNQAEFDGQVWELASAPFEGKSLSINISNANIRAYNIELSTANFSTQQSIYEQWQTNVGVDMPQNTSEMEKVDDSFESPEDALSSVGLLFKALQVVKMASEAEEIGQSIKRDLCGMVFGDSENAEIDLYFDLQKLAPGMAGQLAWSIAISKAHHYY
jgi:hypothetical protein